MKIGVYSLNRTAWCHEQHFESFIPWAWTFLGHDVVDYREPDCDLIWVIEDSEREFHIYKREIRDGTPIFYYGINGTKFIDNHEFQFKQGYNEYFFLSRFETQIFPSSHLLNYCPPPFQPPNESEKKPKILFAGADYERRRPFLHRLEREFPERFVCHGFIHPYEKYIDMVAAYQIMLNINSLPSCVYDGRGGNQKVYDATFAGSCLLTEYSARLEENFKLGEEVVEWWGIDDLLEKAGKLLDDPTKCRVIGLKGQRRCVTNYSAEKTAQQILDYL